MTCIDHTDRCLYINFKILKCVSEIQTNNLPLVKERYRILELSLNNFKILKDMAGLNRIFFKLNSINYQVHL